MIIDIQQMSVGSPRAQISEMKGGPELGGAASVVFGVAGIDAPGCQTINYIFGLFQFLPRVACARKPSLLVVLVQANR